MDTANSMFRGYGQVDATQDLAMKRKTRKRCISYTVAAVIVIVVFISVIVGLVSHAKNNSHGSTSSPTPNLTSAASLKTVCSVTDYPDACISSISKFPASNTTDPQILFNLSLKVVADELSSLSGLPKKLADMTTDEKIKSVLGVCGELIEDAMDHLNDTISATEGDGKLDTKKINDLKTWLSTAITNHETCFDALDEFNTTDSTISQNLKSAMRNSTEFTSNSLAIVAKVLAALKDIKIPVHGRRLLNSESPSWVSPTVRRLLDVDHLMGDVIVAADGSGDVKTVSEAVARIPSKSKKMFVIYVKAGTYVENVVIDKSKWNVMIFGDGKTKTIISGSKNNADGTPTFWTATLVTQGQGLIMKDIGIINTAGPEKHQAVAMRSDSDRAIYYRCSFDGYQDTLYSHSNRQYYRDCDITGTVDFIFGNAAVVFQGCNIRPRQPLANQFNTITAQGKTNSHQNTGISIQYCTISTNGDVTTPTYLGRPWKDFSTTVVMQSVIGPIVKPVGWISWVSGTDPPSTIFYGEYKNSGSASRLTQRVKWAGFEPAMAEEEVWKFMAYMFIGGMDWIPGTGVPFSPT